MGRNAETSFQGRSLVVLAGTRGGGARAIAIDFDEGFASCKVKVTVGREGGAEVVRGRSIISGNAVEFKPQGTSGESCAIRDGNVFAR
jgi:hypothetical protein